jgi:PPOX class probable F420-dependent enzyme
MRPAHTLGAMTKAKLPEAPIPESHEGILENALLAVVSTISYKDGLISTNPVGFDWDGDYVRISTLKSRVKYRNLLSNAQIAFCAVDPTMGTRYIEIRGYAEISEDPENELPKKVAGRMGGENWTPEMDGPGAERVSIKIVPTQVSTPTLYGGQLDQRAAEFAESQNPSVP